MKSRAVGGSRPPGGRRVAGPGLLPIIQVGRNCWRQESADRVAFLIDAAAYYDAFAQAVERARRSIWILGWDIHSRTRLRLGRAGAEGGDEDLAGLLNRVVRRQPGLIVRILVWDPSPIYILEREFSPQIQFGFRTASRVHLRLASAHVTGGSHHQKVVVIDGRMAFVGGIDLTIARWDTPEHRPRDPRRALPSGRLYEPFHDVQMALDGPAAFALCELACQRWREATGHAVEPETAAADPWPPDLVPDLSGAAVGLARTQPAFRERPPLREVELLFLDAIAAARDVIYLETQYFTSRSLCEALCRRLRCARGPQVVMVTPLRQCGRLEQSVMGVLRSQVVTRLLQADLHGRLEVLSPVSGKDFINVHSKVMIVDDRFARIGSANLSNRSMGMDTECDAAIEAPPEDARSRRAIVRFRHRLIAEHLGVTVEALDDAVSREGSLIGAIKALRGGPRTLVRLPVDGHAANPLIERDLLDPDGPIEETLARRVISEETVDQGRRRLPRVVIALLATLLLAGLWTWASLKGWPGRDELAAWLEPAQDTVWGPPLTAVLMGAALALMFPVNLLIVAMVMMFGPWLGAAVSFAGSALGACAGYYMGRLMWPQTVRTLAGRRLTRLSRHLARRGVISVIAIRVVPIAPFTVASLVAGSARIRFRDFMLGTMIAMTPGIVGLSFASDRIISLVKNPSAATLAWAAAALVVLGAAVYWLHRLLQRSRPESLNHAV